MTVDNVAPTVTVGNISISGASGTSGAFKVGDTLTASWNNSSSGDNNSDISVVSVNFSAFGGGTAVSANDSNGTWTATLAITEDAGGVIESSNLNVSLTATDNAGNATTTSDTSNATLDNNTPAAPTSLDLADSSDTGSSSTDNITNDSTPTISGTAEANSTVELFHSGTTSLGTATVDSGGNWTLTPGTLSDSAYSIKAKATDTVGNTSAASDVLSLTVDTGAPVISAISDQVINEDKNTGAVAFTVSDAITAAADLTVASASSDTTLIPVTSIALGGTDGNRTVTVTPAADLNGSATITLTPTDTAGNSNNSAFKVTVNSVNDTPSFVKGADVTVSEDAETQSTASFATSLSTGPSNESGQALTFQVSNDNSALFSAQPAIGSDGTLTFTPAAHANGSATVTVALKDGGGTANGGADTSAAQTFTINVTSVNDTPAVAAPASLSVNEDTNLSVSGISVDDVETGEIAVLLTVANGTLTVALADGVVISSGSNESASVTLTGQESALNSVLATVIYRGSVNFSGTETLSVKATDASAATGEVSTSITVNAVVAAATVIEVGTLLRLEASGIERVLPFVGGQPYATASNATLTFLPYPEFDTVSLSGVPLFRDSGDFDGFGLPDLDVSMAAAIGSGNNQLLQLEGVKLLTTNYRYQSGQSSGTFGLSVASGTLYPGTDGISALIQDDGSGGSGAQIAFDNQNGALTLTAERLNASIGGEYVLSASGVALNYDPNETTDQTLATVAAAQLELLFAGGAVAQVADWNIRGTGMLLGNQTVSLQDLVLDNCLGLTSPSLIVENIGYTRGQPLQGQFGIGAVTAVLYPDKQYNGNASDGTDADNFGLLGSYDLAAKRFSLTIDVFDLTVTDVLAVSDSSVTLQYDPNGAADQILATVNTPQVTFAPLTVQGSVPSLEIRKDAFQFESGTITPEGTVEASDLFALTGASVTLTSFGVDYSNNGTILGGITLNADVAQVFPSSTTFTATGSSITGTFRFEGLDSTGITLSAGAFDMDIASRVKFAGTDIQFQSKPGAGEYVAVFDSVAAELPGQGITGQGGGFALDRTGDLVRLDSFLVNLTIEAGTANTLGWPDWLGIELTRLELRWPEPSAAPTDFGVIFSANLTRLQQLEANVTGEVTDVVVDLGLLNAGEFAITSIGEVSASIDAELFGGLVNRGGNAGGLFLGIIRVDADGNEIQIEDSQTPVADRILYGGIRAKFSLDGIPGFDGFEIRIGLSSLGPLNVFVEAGVEVLLDASSGLTMRDFRGGVTFNTELPKIEDPLLLRGSEFKPTGQMTFEEWRDILRQAVRNQIKAGVDTWSAFSETMKIEGGATLFSQHTGEDVFHAEVDVVLDTKGKLALNALLVYYNRLEQRAILYTDLAELANSRLKILMLVDTPADNPIVTLRGVADFVFSRTDGTGLSSTNPADQFEIRLTGGIDVNVPDPVAIPGTGTPPLAVLTLEGTIAMSASPVSNPDTIDLGMEGELFVTVLGERISLAGSAGAFHYKETGTFVEIWGALAITRDLNFLKDAGITANATTVFRLNGTNQDRTETLNVPGRGSFTASLPSYSTSFLLDGELVFAQLGVDWFRMAGVFSADFGAQAVTVVADADLIVGLASDPALTVGVQGLFQVSADGFAGKLQVNHNPPSSPIVPLALRGDFLIEFNTTSRAISYTLPESANPVNGSRTITVRAGPTPENPGIYLELQAQQAELTLLDLAAVAGDFTLLVTPEYIEGGGTPSLELRNGSQTVVAIPFQAEFRIFFDGLAFEAALKLENLKASSPLDRFASFGFDLTGEFRIEANLTNQERTVSGGNTLGAGPYVRVRGIGTVGGAGLNVSGEMFISVQGNGLEIGVQGTMTVLTFTAEGNFAFIFTSNGIELEGTGTMNVDAVGLAFPAFQISGGMRLSAAGLAGVFSLSAGNQAITGGGFSLSGTWTWEINTTGSQQTIAGKTLSAGSYVRFRVDGILTVVGTELDGVFVIELDDQGASIAVDALIRLKVGSVTLFNLKVQGGARVDARGIAASLSASPQSLNSSLGIGFSMSFTVEINSTGVSKTVGSKTLSAGRYVRIESEGALIVGGIRLDGSFAFTVGTSFVGVEFSAEFGLKAGNRTIIGFRISNATLRIYANGIAGSVSLAYRAGTQGLSGEFVLPTAGFRLEINTTPQRRFIGGWVNAKTVQVVVNGNLKLAGSFTLEGTFKLTQSSSYVGLRIDGKIKLFNSSLSLGSDFRVYSDGIVGTTALTGTTRISGGFFSATGNPTLRVNTTNINRFGVKPGTLVVWVPNASLGIKGLALKGSFTIGVESGFLVIRASRLTVNLLSKTFTFSGFVKSNGQFSLSAETGRWLGTESLAQLRGTVSVTISNTQGVKASYKGNAYVLNKKVDSFSGTITFSNSFRDYSMSVNVDYSLTKFSVFKLYGRMTFKLSNGNIRADFTGNAKVFGAISASTFGFIDTKTGKYMVRATHTVKLGDNSFGAKATFRATIANSSGSYRATYKIPKKTWDLLKTLGLELPGSRTRTFTIKYSSGFTAAYTGAAWGFGVTIKFSASINSSGRGSLTIDGNKVELRLKGGFKIWDSDIAGATAFLDVNRNGVLDDGEPFTIADDQGNFSFVDSDSTVLTPELPDSLRPFDLNQDQVLDATEGRWIVIGGVDLDTLEAQTGTTVLEGGAASGVTNRSGALVVFDANQNGTADTEEPTALTDESGAYTFVSFSPASGAGILVAYDVNANDVLDPEEGQLRVIGGTAAGSIDNALLTGYAPGSGAERIFFDVNFNGVLDDNEVWVVPDATGFYSFETPDDGAIDTLGQLRPFDTNGNGQIDPEEGVIVITGGVDKNTGLPNKETIEVSSTALSEGFESTVNPLTGLLGAVAATGVSREAANTALQAAFGLSVGTQVSQFDPRNVPASEAASLSAILAASSKMNYLGFIAAPLFGMETEAVRDLLDREIASRIASLTPVQQNGSYLVQFNLSDSDLIDSVLASVQSVSGSSVTADQRGAVATLIGELHQKADQVLASGTGDPISGLAPLKAIAQTDLPDQIRAMLAGDITPDQLVATGIAPFLATQEVPIHIAQVEDQVLEESQVSIPVYFENVNSVVRPHTVEVVADNPELLPASGIALSDAGDHKLLTLTPSSGVLGETTVTVRSLLETSAGGTLESTESFLFTAEPVNTAPTISAVSDQFVASGGVVGPITIHVADAEVDASSLQVTVTSSDHTILDPADTALSGSGGTRFLTLTPKPLGEDVDEANVDVSIEVSDGVLSEAVDFTVTILTEEDAVVVAANDAPSFTMGPNQQLVENAGTQTIPEWATEISPGPSDETGQSVQFLVSSDNPGLFRVQPTISSDGQLSYAIWDNANGSAIVTVILQDDGGTAAGGTDTSDPQTFTISVGEINFEPVLGSISDKVVEAGAELGFSVLATDIDGDVVSYTLAPGAPVGASIDPGTGIFRWTPEVSQSGERHLITVRATDNGTPNLTVVRTFVVEVLPLQPTAPINSAPSVAPIEDRVVLAGKTLRLTALATDSDVPVNQLSFGLDEAPVGASIDPVTGEFSWTPTSAENLGENQVTVRVTDNGQPSLSATESFKIEVQAAPNSAPVMAGLRDMQVERGGLLSIFNAAGDLDVPVQTITWSLEAGVPDGMIIDGATGLLTWQVSDTEPAGKHLVTVTATDNGTPSLSVHQSFEVEVLPVNVAPTVLPIEDVVLKLGSPVPVIPLKGIGAGAVNEIQEITVSAVSDNPELIPNPEVLYETSSGEGVLVLKPAAGQIGEAIISVSAKDDGGTSHGGKDTTVIQFKVTVEAGSLQDIYLQNEDGSLAVWEMNGVNLVRGKYLEPMRPGEAGWNVRATADFDQDGKTDLLFQKDDGSLAVWFMDGAKLKLGAMLNPTTTGDRNWQVVGADDMDGDGQVDLVFQNAANGMLAAWLMDGLTLRQAVLLSPSAPGESGWSVVGTGDVDNDGKADLVFQRTDGMIAFWLMDGTSLVSGQVLSSAQPLEPLWQVKGIADLNQDDQLDLVVQTTDGSLGAMYLNGTSLLESASFDPAQAGPGWHIVGS